MLPSAGACPRSGANAVGLTPFDRAGGPRMVEGSAKDAPARVAVARGRVVMQSGALAAIKHGTVGKGDVLATAQVAAVMAAKRTWELIPMCHPLLLAGVEGGVVVDDGGSAGE